MMVVAQRVIGKLDTRWRSNQQVEKKRLAVGIWRRCPQPGFFCAILDAEDVVMNRWGTDATALDGFERVGVRQNVCRYRLVASDQSLAGQVLLELERLGRKSLRDTANTAVLQWCEPAEVQFAFFKIALPDALVLDGEQQVLVFAEVEFFE